MPKRGNGRVRNWRTDNEHFEHDDRERHHGNNSRRVVFKLGNKGKNKFHLSENAKYMLDDDIDMSGGNQAHPRKGAYRGRGARPHNPTARFVAPTRKRFVAGALPWYKILIPYGAKHDKDFILKSLLNQLTPDVFIPLYYKILGNAAVFFVDDVKIAEKLFYADRKIVMPDGFKLAIIVRNACPNDNIDETVKEKMKLVMAKRYDANNKALDLTKFHADPDLVDVFCALFRPLVMLAAIDIMAENIPDLVALNLNDNKLNGLDHLRRLSLKLKNLKILYMADNKIPHIGSLDPLKPLPLVELQLAGNPLVNRFNDHDVYISDVRKKFPKLMKLDGVELPPAIGFDVSEDVALPPLRQSFLIDPAGQGLVRDFLKEYFAYYDSESRQPLLDAYHEHATMSMTANYLSNDNRNSPSSRLNAYISSSRNIIRITERDSRRRYLKTGRLQVVSFLSDLPKTTHDLMGFAVDLLVYSPTMILLSMNGVYKETNQPAYGNPTRSFHRTFLVVPNGGGGFCILNDMLFVSNTSREQDAAAFTAPAPAPAPAPASAPAPAPALASASAPAPALDEQRRAELVAMFSQHTGMNHHYSLNCLNETEWDPQRALVIFNKLHSEGKLPPEAFIK